jgi:hypothetical protein
VRPARTRHADHAPASGRPLRQNALFPLANWAQAIDALLRIGEDRDAPVPVVLDEFPCLVAQNPAIPSLIQNALSPRGRARRQSRTRGCPGAGAQPVSLRWLAATAWPVSTMGFTCTGSPRPSSPANREPACHRLWPLLGVGPRRFRLGDQVRGRWPAHVWYGRRRASRRRRSGRCRRTVIVFMTAGVIVVTLAQGCCRRAWCAEPARSPDASPLLKVSKITKTSTPRSLRRPGPASTSPACTRLASSSSRCETRSRFAEVLHDGAENLG